MRVLGIDPGLTRCGMGVVEGSVGRALSLVDVNTLQDGEPRNNFLKRALTWNENGVLNGARHITLGGSYAYITAAAGVVIVNLMDPLKPKVAAVLAKAGASVDIHLACAMGDVDRVRAFVRNNPDAVNARVDGAKKTIAGEGETPLTVAARYGQRKIVEFLLAQGALATGVPSPLPGAVHKGDRMLVRRLLRAGADPNTLGPHGHAALHAAAAGSHASIVRMLLVPATMELLGDRNWWLPRWLDRTLPRVHIEAPPDLDAELAQLDEKERVSVP